MSTNSTGPRGGGDRAAQARHELRFWRERLAAEGTLANSHYEYFYTTHFALDKSFYAGKRVLDVGCGPRGSLEWAAAAACRCGLDPLAVEYRALGTSRQRMTYVAAVSESIPFRDESFDVVSSFNSLDNVRSLGLTAREIARVLVPGGVFLLLTDIHAEPTVQEPLTFGWEVVAHFRPALTLAQCTHYERSPGGMYQSLLGGTPFDHSNPAVRWGVLSAKFVKAPRDAKSNPGEPPSALD